MPRNPTLFILAAFAVAPLPLSGSSWAASSDEGSTPVAAPPLPVPAPRWGHPPEAVRMAAAALHDACAAWPQQIPLVLEPPSLPAAAADQSYATVCKLALNPSDFAQGSLLEGGALGAAAAGIAFVAFKVAKYLLFGLIEIITTRLTSLWDRRRRRANGWLD